MDCQTVRSLLVPYLDGELAPAQVAWVESHCEVCASCRVARQLLQSQSLKLATLPPAPMSDSLARELFVRMDSQLESELDRFAHAPAPAPLRTPAAQTTHYVSRLGLAAYVSLLSAALIWGWWNQEVAADALVREEAMRVQLERAERLRAIPMPLPQQTPQYRTVAHSRGRGHL